MRQKGFARATTTLAGMLAVGTAAPPGWAKDDLRPGNPLVAALARCLDIRENAERLACTDVAARALVDAERTQEVVVIDKERAKRTRRSLFGIALGGADPITGRDETRAERIEQLDTDVAGVRSEANGRWLLTLVEGGRWRTTEPWDGGTVPRPGDKVLVKRAALGSYTMRLAGARLVRVIRVN